MIKEQDVHDFVDKTGWEHKDTAKVFNLRECPFCNNTNFHFYMKRNDGCFFCHKCGAKGSFWDMCKHQGVEFPGRGKEDDIVRPISSFVDKPVTHKPISLQYVEDRHQALLRNEPCMMYLHAKGYKDETIKRFKLGYDSAESKDGYREEIILFPNLRNGAPVNIKSKIIFHSFKDGRIEPCKKAFRQIPDAERALYNFDCLFEHDEIIITEGEMDANILIQAGYENVVSLTQGAKNWSEEWTYQLQGKKLYLALDNDAPGEEGARQIAKRFEVENNCLQVVFPKGLEPKTYLATHSKEDFDNLLKSARKIKTDSVVSVTEAIEMIRNVKTESIFRTQWASVNKLLSAPREGEMLVLTAPEKTGKTSFVMNWAWFLAKMRNVPVLIWCMESPANRLAERIIQADMHIMTDEVLDKIDESLIVYRDIPLYFVCAAKSGIDEVKAVISSAVRRYGIKFVIFDNLNFLCRDHYNMTAQTSIMSKEFKLMAEDLNVLMCVIAQPRKLKKDANGEETGMVTADDIRDTRSVAADADYVVVMNRKRAKNDMRMASMADEIMNMDNQSLYEPVTCITLDRARYGKTGYTFLYFQEDFTLFREIERTGEKN